MPKLVWLNGEVMPLENAVTSVQDHAHLYGDGLFEGIRIYDGKVFKLDEHLQRLYHGIAYLGFEMKMSIADLRATILDVCRQADIRDKGYIRLNVTRGSGLGLDPKNARSWYNRGLAYASLRDYDLALENYAEAVKLAPSDARIWQSLAAAEYSKGAYDRAILDYGEAIARDPNNAPLLGDRGVRRPLV